MGKNMFTEFKKQSMAQRILHKIIPFFVIIIALVIAWLVFAEAFGEQLCENIATGYSIAIFLAGIILALKLKILDSKLGLDELIFFIIGTILNIAFLVTAYFWDCYSSERKALLLLNAIIWWDFIIVIRNLYLVIVLYFSEWSQKRKERKDYPSAKSDLESKEESYIESK